MYVFREIDFQCQSCSTTRQEVTPNNSSAIHGAYRKHAMSIASACTIGSNFNDLVSCIALCYEEK